MTYGNRICECSGYCSGWQSFWLDYGEIAGQLQPLESKLHRFWCEMDIPLRHNDAAMHAIRMIVKTIRS